MLIRGTALTLIMLAIFQTGCRPNPKTVTNADDSKTSHVEESMPIEEWVPDEPVLPPTPLEDEQQLVRLKIEPSINADWHEEFKAKYPDSPLFTKHQISFEPLSPLTIGVHSNDDEVRNVQLALDSKLTVESLTEYMRMRFPNRPTDYGDVISNINSDIDHVRFKTLKQIDDAMNSTEELRHQIRQRVGSLWIHDGQVSAPAELVWALGCVDKSFRDQPHWDVLHETKKVIEELIAEK